MSMVRFGVVVSGIAKLLEVELDLGSRKRRVRLFFPKDPRRETFYKSYD